MKNILTLILSLSLLACNGQSANSYSEIIKDQAAKMGQSLVQGDFSALAKYTYPKIVEVMGGQDAMIETMKNTLEEMKMNGGSYLSIHFGEPTAVILAYNELQCTLPQTTEMKLTGGRLISKSTLIAISADSGKNWYFIDANGKDIQTLKRALPNLSGDLVLPPAEDPVLYDK